MAEHSAPSEPLSQRIFLQDTGSSRRPIDLTTALVGALITLLTALSVADGSDPFDRSVRRLAADLPAWVPALFDAVYLLGAMLTIAGVVLAFGTGVRRARLPATLLLAAGFAVAGVVLASFLLGAGLPELTPEPVRATTAQTFPTVRVAAATALLLTLRPWLVQGFRELATAVVVIQCIAAWAIGAGGPDDIIGALGIGMLAAGLALVMVGSPAGHPDLAHVAHSLTDLGVEADDLRFAEQQPWGTRMLRAVSPTAGPLLIKVYGRDAIDARRAARWWRTLVYRDQSAPDATRLQLVEHEALVTILAERAGNAVPQVVAAASAQGDALLVLTAAPPPLAEATEIDDQALTSTWSAVARLHAAGLVHGRLTLDRLGIGPDGEAVLWDFAEGKVAASPEERAREVAILLIALAVRVGPDRATDAALCALGADQLAAAQPYLQRAVLPREVRAEPRLRPTIAAVTTAVVDRTGASRLPPAPLVRFSWRGLLQTVLLLVAAYALLSTLLNLDWVAVWDTWKQADWRWVVAALVIAQGTAVVDAMSVMSAVTTRLPLGPMVQLQYAVKTLGLAVSGSVSRLALNTSFLRRYGEPPPVAVTAVALDAASASLCNVVVVLLGLLLAQNTPKLHLSTPDDLTQLVLLLLAAVALTALVIVVVGPVRRRVVVWVRSGWASLRVVTTSPARLLLMLGTNLASLLITAVALGCVVEGLHPAISYGQAVFVVGAAALFSALVPVPGGVGVGEAALAAGLVAVGMPSGPAFAVAVTQRIATSYLPPVYGAWTLRWLRKQDYID